MISSHEALPLCEGLEKEDKDEEEQEKEEESEKTVAEVAIATEFYLKEVRDYCLPDRDMVMFRYSLRAKKECPVTIQLTTSKIDAHISLEVHTHTHTYTHTHTHTDAHTQRLMH